MQPHTNQAEGLNDLSMLSFVTFEKANLNALGNNHTVSDLILSVSSHISAGLKITNFSGLTQARSVETHKNALKADRHIKEMQVMKEFVSNFTLSNVKQYKNFIGLNSITWSKVCFCLFQRSRARNTTALIVDVS